MLHAHRTYPHFILLYKHCVFVRHFTHPEDGPWPKIWNCQSFFRAAKRPCVVVRLKILNYEVVAVEPPCLKKNLPIWSIPRGSLEVGEGLS